MVMILGKGIVFVQILSKYLFLIYSNISCNFIPIDTHQNNFKKNPNDLHCCLFETSVTRVHEYNYLYTSLEVDSICCCTITVT